METEPPGRVLALDIGQKRIGLAVSDALGITAQGLPTLERRNLRTDLAALGALAREREVVLFLAGLPLNMGGGEGRQAALVREFAAKLERETGIPVEFRDERLTTVEAQRVLRSAGASIGQRARAVDRLAAVILLEGYLDARRHAGEPGA
jgi:putative Holliday junction resolvase